MPHVLQTIPVAMPSMRAVRSRGREPYVGLKDTFVLARFAEGRATFWTQGQVYEGAPGTIVIHQAGDVHRDVKREGMVTLEILRLPPGLVEEVTTSVRTHACLAPGDERARPLHRLLDAVNGRADRFTLEVALAEALGALGDLAALRHSHTVAVRRAIELMRERVAEPLTLDELAQHARLDKFHLCRAFRAQVGMAPHAYLTQLRIMHAKNLLAAGARPVDVAPRVGLYDQSQLNRHFRRIVGMTPGQFARTS